MAEKKSSDPTLNAAEGGFGALTPLPFAPGGGGTGAGGSGMPWWMQNLPANLQTQPMMQALSDPNQQTPNHTGPMQAGGQTALAQLLQQAQGSVAGNLQSANQSAKTAAGQATGQASNDPMALQLYFAQTIAPLLQQIQGQQSNQINNYQAATQALMNHVQLPPGMKDIMQANMQQGVADLQGMNSANAAASLQAPFYDQLMNQVSQARDTQMKAYIKQLENAATGSTGTGTVNPFAATPTTGG